MRLFVAIDVPEKVCDYLQSIQEYIKGADVKLTREFHLTLKFVGETSKLEQIIEALDKICFSSFNITLSNNGVFPERGMPRVIWMGIEESSPLRKLRDDIYDALKFLNIPDDCDHFNPHLTLARIRQVYDVNLLAKSVTKKVDPISFKVDNFKLYRSNLLPQGVKHTVLKEFSPKHL